MTPEYEQPQPTQLTLIDLVSDSSPHAPTPHRTHRKVDAIQAQLRQLCDELNQALYSSRRSDLPAIHAPSDAFDLLSPMLSNLDQEELWTVLLNTRNKVIKLVRVYRGSVNSSQVRIAEVIKQAIIEGATSMIIAHNHPSGDPTPSPEDIAVTRNIIAAGKLLDIEILDHLVIGCTTYVSLKQRGLAFS